MSKFLSTQASLANLLLIDAQEKLFNAMPEAERAAVLTVWELLLDAAKALAVPIFYSEQYPQGLGQTLPTLQGRLLDIGSGQYCDKTCFSAEHAFALPKVRPQVVLMGMESHICVLQTALAFLTQGKTVFVVEDGVLSRKVFNKNNAMARMRQAGVMITSAESVLFEWLEDAKHPEFRAFSKRLR
jgi:nicotinamidase-related amidase